MRFDFPKLRWCFPTQGSLRRSRSAPRPYRHHSSTQEAHFRPRVCVDGRATSRRAVRPAPQVSCFLLSFVSLCELYAEQSVFSSGLLRAFSHGQESMVATRAPTPARRNSLTGGEGPEPPTNTIRQDLDFMSAFVGASGTASTGVSPSVVKDQPESSAPTPAAGPSATDNLFPSTFGNSLFNPSFTFNPTGLPMGASPSQPHLASGATPFPMLPFSESQPFHQLANALDSSLDFDFGFEDPELPAPAPAEAFNFLLEDSALDFWNSFSGDGDWTQQASGGV